MSNETAEQLWKDPDWTCPHCEYANLAIRKKCRNCGAASPSTEIGPTGEFPEGKLNETDEGELAMAIGVTEGKIVLNFGKPIAWIGMSPDDALDVAEILIKKANAIKGGSR